MNAQITKLHETNVSLFSSYRDLEGKLLDSLQEFDSHRGFEAMGFSSLHAYCLQSLGMSKDQAFTFIRVSRKSVEVPALKEAIRAKKITISSARVIAPVLNKKNQRTWLEKAMTLPKPALEKEIVKINPKAINRDRMIPLTKNLSEARGALSQEAQEILRRVKELESNRTSKGCDLDAAIIAMGKPYLQQNDPIEKAKRAQNRAKRTGPEDHLKSRKTQIRKRAIPARVSHKLNLRDQGKCRVRSCGSRHFTHTHHIKPFSHGGTHRLDNLITLCSAHHRALHNGVKLEFDSLGRSAESGVVPNGFEQLSSPLNFRAEAFKETRN